MASIGGVSVASIFKPPIKSAQSYMDVSPPGTSGVTLLKLGTVAPECMIEGYIYVANAAAISTFETNIKALAAGNSVTVTDDHGNNYTGVQVLGSPIIGDYPQCGTSVGVSSNSIRVSFAIPCRIVTA